MTPPIFDAHLKSADALDTPHPFLGGISAAEFMREYWQRKPLLIRQAADAKTMLPSKADLFSLAKSEDVESRMVQQHPTQGWQLKRGPFPRLPTQSKSPWSLLVQGVNLHQAGAQALMESFRFVPDARLDDIMISWASEGGGVGPHQDRYDVFLLQIDGRRRWKIAPPQNFEMVEGLPLKIIADFQATQEWVLEPGDMLYLPPLWGHDGVAEGGECMTCSIGFTVPEAGDLARELVLRMAEHWEDEPLYQDPDQPATSTPAHIPTALQMFAKASVERMMEEPLSLACALGEWLSEPKPHVWFEAHGEDWRNRDVFLNAKTKMLYDAHHIFINGEGFLAKGHDAAMLRQLADHRCLAHALWKSMTPDAQAVMAQWHELGWLHQAD
jgi:50S ribosomal protein L16 3-hydroxylase